MATFVSRFYAIIACMHTKHLATIYVIVTQVH